MCAKMPKYNAIETLDTPNTANEITKKAPYDLNKNNRSVTFSIRVPFCTNGEQVPKYRITTSHDGE